ncbi:MAG: hypothetical protein ACM3Y8_02420, partial [Byssovorax cruenta]
MKKENEYGKVSLAVPSLPPSGWAQLLNKHFKVLSFYANLVIIFISTLCNGASGRIGQGLDLLAQKQATNGIRCG